MGSRQLTKPQQALAHLPVTGHKERWGTLVLSQAEELLCQLVPHLVLRLLYIEVIEPHQRRKELRALPHLLAQLPRPAIGLSRFRGRKPLGESHRSAEHEL